LNLDSGFSFTKFNEENGKYTRVNHIYGFVEDRLKGNLTTVSTRKTTPQSVFPGGSTVSQINANAPISKKLINSVSTLFLKKK
jgi:hypothetical protein